PERAAVMGFTAYDRGTNDEARMTNDEGSWNEQMPKQMLTHSNRHSDFVIPSSLGIRNSSLQSNLVATDAQLTELLSQIEIADRIALDTEADSLHSYREKLCLLQISVPASVDAHGCQDFILDPLAGLDLQPLRRALESREIVLHGADYDLRMLRRGLNFAAGRIFDTVIAARLLGIREFSLGALVKRFFDVELQKHSQKANWAIRPLPPRMMKYALDDVHYLLPLATKLEE